MALRNAFELVSTEETLAELRDIFLDRASSTGDAHLVGGNKLRYRREFNDTTFSSWDVVTGPGMTVTANGNMLVTTGTTPNSVTTITSKQSFTVPFKAAFGFLISQKIVNQEFYVELVAEDEFGAIDETRVAAWRIAGSDSVSTTTARVEVRNGGPARTQSGSITSQALQTGSSVYEITLESDEVWFNSRVADSIGARSASVVRNSIAPDPNTKYRLRYRIVNGATAPASTTTFTSGFATCVDYTEFQMEVTGGSGSSSGGQGIPVLAAGTFGVSGSVSLGASSTVTGVTPTKIFSTASTNAAVHRAAPARLYGFYLANTTPDWRFVKFYNKITAPTVGTDVPVFTLALPPNSVIDESFAVPASTSTGLGIAITALAADADATAIGAGDVIGMVMSVS